MGILLVIIDCAVTILEILSNSAPLVLFGETQLRCHHFNPKLVNLGGVRVSQTEKDLGFLVDKALLVVTTVSIGAAGENFAEVKL